MKFGNLIFLGLFIFIFSCTKNNINDLNTNIVLQETENNKKARGYFVSKNSKISLNTTALKIVENWQEYQNIAEFIPKYYKTTTKKSLFNSQRLVELTQQLKDTIRIKKFDEPSFRIRLNVLHNEALRLADMDSITSITNLEVIQENKNIVGAFDAINAKINTLVNKELLENDLKEFDYLFAIEDSIEEKTNSKILTKKNRNQKIFNKRIQPLSEIDPDDKE